MGKAPLFAKRDELANLKHLQLPLRVPPRAYGSSFVVWFMAGASASYRMGKAPLFAKRDELANLKHLQLPLRVPPRAYLTFGATARLSRGRATQLIWLC